MIENFEGIGDVIIPKSVSMPVPLNRAHQYQLGITFDTEEFGKFTICYPLSGVIAEVEKYWEAVKKIDKERKNGEHL